MPRVNLPSLRDAARRILRACDLSLGTDCVEYYDDDILHTRVEAPLTLGMVEDLRRALVKDGAIVLPKIDRCVGCENNDDQDNAGASMACSVCLMREGGGLL